MNMTTLEFQAITRKWVMDRKRETGRAELTMEDYKEFLAAFPEHFSDVTPSEEGRKFWMAVHREWPLL